MMHTGKGYDNRIPPHSPSTNDLAEINMCSEYMGMGKKTKESDYAMDEGPIHGGGHSHGGGSNKHGKMSY